MSSDALTPIDLTDELDLLAAYSRTANSAQRKAEIFQIFPLLEQLKLDLALGLYQTGRYRCFVVKDPKMREIFAPSFRDRLVHHLITGRLMPIFDQRLIDDSYANRPHKGTQKAVLRLQYFMRRLPKTAYVMQCDIAAYFTSIDRRIMLDIFTNHLARSREIAPEERGLILNIVTQILAQNPAQKPIFTGNRHLLAQIPSHKSLFKAPSHVGMPIGALTSQFFSNLYLNELDRFVKFDLRVPFYLRYVDDFVLLHESAEQLHTWKSAIESFLADRLRLKLHPNKTLVQPIHRGCDFVGYVVRPHHIQVRRRTIRAMKRRLYFFNHLLDPGGFPHLSPPPQSRYGSYVRRGLISPPITPSLDLLQHMLQVINSYLGVMAHAQSYRIRRQLYLDHFHHLQNFFIPAQGFTKVISRPLALMEREGIIAI